MTAVYSWEFSGRTRGGGPPGSGVSAGLSDITASLAVSRSSGTAPLAVRFDARATTSNISQLTNAAAAGLWRTVHYDFDFGDSGSGTFAATGNSQNTFSGGPIAAHVYKNAGNYSPQVIATAGHRWRTSTAAAPTGYIVDDFAWEDPLGGTSYNTYRCLVPHTPGTFSTDLGAGKWVLYATGLVQSAAAVQPITVAAQSTTFSGNLTTYISLASNYTNAPSGSVHANSSVTYVAGHRYMFRPGEDYSSINVGFVDDAYFVVDPLTAGAAPIVGAATNANRTVVDGLQINNSSFMQNCTDPLVLRCTFNQSTNDILCAFGGNTSDDFQNSVRGFYVENTCSTPGGSTGGSSTARYHFFGGGRDFVLMGNDAGDQPLHTCRVYVATGAVIANNKFKGKSSGGIYHALKFHSNGFTEWPTVSTNIVNGGGDYANTYCVIANNIFNDATSTDNWTNPCEPQNAYGGGAVDPTMQEGNGYIIVENNQYIHGTATSQDLKMVGKYMTSRGNFSNTGSLLTTTQTSADAAIPSNWVNPYFAA